MEVEPVLDIVYRIPHLHALNLPKVEKEKEQLKNELTKIKKQIVSSEQIIANQRAEVQKLNQIIQEADEERQRQVGNTRPCAHRQ